MATTGTQKAASKRATCSSWLRATLRSRRSDADAFFETCAAVRCWDRQSRVNPL